MIHTGLQNDLIEACKKGDPKAQLQVYKSYYKQMFRISYDLVGHAGYSDEIVRESFMTVFGMTGTFKCQADFISRLRWIVENKSFETRRKNKVPSPGMLTDRVLV